SLPTKLKELPSKFNELTEEVKGLKKQVHDLEIELPGDLKDIPTNLEDFNKTVISVTSQVAELKTLQWELLAEFLSVPTQAIASKKTEDASVPLTSLAGTKSAKGEKNINQTTVTYLPKSSSQPEGEHIKKDKGKKLMSSEGIEKESTESSSGSDDDDEASQLTSFMVESFKKKKMEKFDYVTEGGAHIHLTKEQINEQKRIEEDAKAKAAKQEREVRKA
ncbi:hypothetical protein Tco_1574914, partial [Tanacetum coccineum]